jgi:hypothetical protein
MADLRCGFCGNAYDKCFEIRMGDSSQWFDCFECAIAALAPACSQCGVRILGHGLEAGGHFYCCDHCARQAGVPDLRDRAGSH